VRYPRTMSYDAATTLLPALWHAPPVTPTPNGPTFLYPRATVLRRAPTFHSLLRFSPAGVERRRAGWWSSVCSRQRPTQQDKVQGRDPFLPAADHFYLWQQQMSVTSDSPGFSVALSLESGCSAVARVPSCVLQLQCAEGRCCPWSRGMSSSVAIVATCNLNQWALDFDGNLRRVQVPIAFQQ
jgi:hypothetical protein